MGRHVHIADLRRKTESLYKKGYHRGVLTGFQTLKEAFSVVKGTTLYLYAPPFTSKTWLKYELLIQLSEFYGYKHGIFDPETGSPEEIVRYLTEMVVGKDYHDTYKNQMSETERIKAEAWLMKHFFIVDGSKEDFTARGVYDEFDAIENEYGIKLDTTSVDPFDDLDHDPIEFNQNRIDQDYIKTVLKFVRKDAKKKNRYNIIVTHVRDMDKIHDKQTGVIYRPPCSPFDIAMGQAWFRKGLAMLGMWKCPKGLITKDFGYPFEGNEILILPHKQKPLGVASQGLHDDPIMLYLDYKKHRMYEKLGARTAYASDPKGWEYSGPDGIENNLDF